jgi:hypothetical protein
MPVITFSRILTHASCPKIRRKLMQPVRYFLMVGEISNANENEIVEEIKSHIPTAVKKISMVQND